MRVQGGTTGLIAAMDAGMIDPLDANFDVRLTRPRNRTNADWRAIKRRNAYLDRLFTERRPA